jgi:acetylornithine/N-succinyldiaminopimelate aminotransferase
MLHNEIIALEDKYLIQFTKKIPVAVDSGSGVDIWDVNGKHYLDFTSGWAVTSLGHADPVILNALNEQAKKIIHNPDAGCTYSPARSKLIEQLLRVLPQP